MLIILSTSFMLLLPVLSFSSFLFHSSLSLLMLLSLLSLLILFPASPYISFLSPNLFTDFFNIPLMILTLWISALMIMASYSNLLKNNAPHLFLFSILILNLILILTFSLSNLILFYIFFEASLIPTMLLILGWGYQPERLQASFYLIIYTVAASLPLLINLLLIFYFNSSLSFTNFTYAPTTTSFPYTSLWWLSLILAFLVKMPLFMFHLWLPKAHVEAPIAGSMILAGILLKLGSYGLIRAASLFPYPNSMTMPFIAAIAMWGAVITSLICTRQPDIKSLIAYSSVGHMGLLTAGTLTSSSWGWEGSLLMMTAHGLCSSALFAIANLTYESTHTRSIFLTKGMLSLFPSVAMLWFILSAANMAAPPSLNLLSEIMLISSILSISLVMTFTLALCAFLAAAYSLFLYTATQHGQPSNLLTPMNIMSTRYTLLLFLHLLPLMTLVLKPDFILNWTSF